MVYRLFFGLFISFIKGSKAGKRIQIHVPSNDRVEVLVTKRVLLGADQFNTGSSRVFSVGFCNRVTLPLKQRNWTL